MPTGQKEACCQRPFQHSHTAVLLRERQRYSSQRSRHRSFGGLTFRATWRCLGPARQPCSAGWLPNGEYIKSALFGTDIFRGVSTTRHQRSVARAMYIPYSMVPCTPMSPVPLYPYVPSSAKKKDPQIDLRRGPPTPPPNSAAPEPPARPARSDFAMASSASAGGMELGGSVGDDVPDGGKAGPAEGFAPPAMDGNGPPAGSTSAAAVTATAATATPGEPAAGEDLSKVWSLRSG